MPSRLEAKEVEEVAEAKEVVWSGEGEV